jgi:hypothetical protein
MPALVAVPVDHGGQISLILKLKLRECARPGNRAGFFVELKEANVFVNPGRPAKRTRLACSHNRGSLYPACIFREAGVGVHPCGETRKLGTGCVDCQLRLLRSWRQGCFELDRRSISQGRM